jgi:hypothetical protein
MLARAVSLAASTESEKRKAQTNKTNCLRRRIKAQVSKASRFTSQYK